MIQLDILPTALAAAGVAAKPEWKLDGVNLLPYLTGEAAGAPHEALYWRFGQQIAIRMGDWKLVKGAGMPEHRQRPPRQGQHRRRAVVQPGAGHRRNQNLAERSPRSSRQLAEAWDQWNVENVDAKWRPRARRGEESKESRQRQGSEEEGSINAAANQKARHIAPRGLRNEEETPGNRSGILSGQLPASAQRRAPAISRTASEGPDATRQPCRPNASSI